VTELCSGQALGDAATDNNAFDKSNAYINNYCLFKATPFQGDTKNDQFFGAAPYQKEDM
jgi:hypothetical protein